MTKITKAVLLVEESAKCIDMTVHTNLCNPYGMADCSSYDIISDRFTRLI